MEKGKPPKAPRTTLVLLLTLIAVIFLILSLGPFYTPITSTLEKWWTDIRPEEWPEEWLTGLWAVSAATEVIIGVLLSLFYALLSKLLLPQLYDATKALSKRMTTITTHLLAHIAAAIDTFSETVHAFSETLANSLGSQTAEVMIAASEAVIAASSYLLRAFQYAGSSLNTLGSVIQKGPVTFVHKLRAPKWYHQKGAIDPGLIEVSLAVTAILIALPSLVSRDAPPAQIAAIEQFRFWGAVILTLTSISLLDIYAKSRGAKSIHILLSPIEDGPLFLLGWAIVIGLIAIAIITFQSGSLFRP